MQSLLTGPKSDTSKRNTLVSQFPDQSLAGTIYSSDIW